MKKLMFILLLGLGVFSSHAQQYFNKRYPLYSYLNTFTSVIPRDGRYYCIGNAWDSSNALTSTEVQGIKFAILDSMGNVLKDTVYQQPGIKNLDASYYSFLSLPDKGFILAASNDDDITMPDAYCMFIRYDSMGNVLWTREYPKPFCTDSADRSWLITNLQPTGTGEWLLLSDLQCIGGAAYAYNDGIMLTKLDSNFNVEWSKEYGNPILDNTAIRIVVEPDAYFVGGGQTNVTVASTGLHSQAYLIKTDTAGVQQWTWLSDPAKITYPICGLIHAKDDGYVYCGAGNGYEMDASGIGTLYAKPWIEKLDSNRDVVWYDTLGAVYGEAIQAIKIMELPDSSMAIAGLLEGGFNPGDTNRSGYVFLVKYRPNGDILWERKYTDDSFAVRIYDINQTPDGGFVMCGEADDAFHFLHPGSTMQEAWIIKVDSNGCASLTDPQCSYLKTPNVTNAQSNIKAYPNPAKDVITIENAAQTEVNIYNVVGQHVDQVGIISQRQQLNITSLPPGSYILQVTGNDGSRQNMRFVKE